MVTFSMKLQSPDYDAVNGYQIPLPINTDTYMGDSMAAILALFNGDNKVLDFRQLRETMTLVGIITAQAATDAGFVNPIQMRDELRRIRGAAAQYGKNNTATVKSWISESISSANWGNASLPADERDAGTTRKAGTVRLIYDKYWHPTNAAYQNLFVYGTVANINFGPRPAATLDTRIPFAVTFLAGSIKTGDS